METKRKALKVEFQAKYVKEINLQASRREVVLAHLAEVHKVDSVFDQMLAFMDSNVDAKILQRADDLTEFLYKSFRDLDHISVEMAEMKTNIRITDEYRPIVVRVKKAMASMGLFEIREIEGFATGEEGEVLDARTKEQTEGTKAAKTKITKAGPAQSQAEHRNEVNNVPQGNSQENEENIPNKEDKLSHINEGSNQAYN